MIYFPMKIRLFFNFVADPSLESPQLHTSTFTSEYLVDIKTLTNHTLLGRRIQNSERMISRYQIFMHTVHTTYSDENCVVGWES